MNNEIKKALEVIDKYELNTKSRKQEKVYKRVYVTEYLRSYNTPWEHIGSLLNRDHSSCVHYQKVYENYYNDDYFLKLIYPLDEELEFYEGKHLNRFQPLKRITIFKHDFDKLLSIKRDNERLIDTFKRVMKKI